MVILKFESVEELSKLIKNYTLLSLIEQAKSQMNNPTPGRDQTPKGYIKSKSTVNQQNMGGGGAFFGKDLDDLEECKSDEECIENEGAKHSSRRKGSAQIKREGPNAKPPNIAYA